MKSALLLLGLLCFYSNTKGQSYSFQPAAEYIGQADLEAYNIFQVDLLNNSADSLYLSWRLVENTLPESWSITLCDNVACYGGLPTTADMDPFAAGDSAFIKLDINPGLVEGSGLIRFRIYEFGSQADYETLTFHISTYPTYTFSPLPLETKLWPNPANTTLHVGNSATAPMQLSIFDQQGRLCDRSLIPANTDAAIDVRHLPEGLYEAVGQSAAGQSHTRFLISH